MYSNNKHPAEELEKYTYLLLQLRISYVELKNNDGLLLCKSKVRLKVLKYKEHGIDPLLLQK